MESKNYVLNETEWTELSGFTSGTVVANGNSIRVILSSSTPSEKDEGVVVSGVTPVRADSSKIYAKSVYGEVSVLVVPGLFFESDSSGGGGSGEGGGTSVTKISQLTNDVGFITDETSTLRYYYKKTEVDAKLVGAMRYKGSVPNLDALNAITTKVNGDMYDVADEGHNYIWSDDEGRWDKSSGIVDLSNYVTEEELAILSAAINNKQDALSNEQITNIGLIPNKVDKVVGKSLLADTEISRLLTLENYDDSGIIANINTNSTNIQNIQNNINTNYYTSSQLDTMFSGKVDTSAIVDFVKGVRYISETGVLEFTQQDGTFINVNIPKDSFVTSGSYNVETGNMELILSSGDVIAIPAQDLVKEYTADGTSIVLDGSTFKIKQSVLDSINEKVSLTHANATFATKIELNNKQDTLTSIQLSNIDLVPNKVDKVEGKSLILDTEISRLLTLTNYDDTVVKANISTNALNIQTNINAIASINTLLTSKVDMNDLGDFVKGVRYIPETGVLEFTQQDGTFINVNIPKDSFVTSGTYNEETQNIELILSSGDVIDIPASELVHEYTADGTSIVLDGSTFKIKQSVLDSINNKLTETQANALYAKLVDLNTVNFELSKKVNATALSTVATSGSYNDLVDKPDIPIVEGFLNKGNVSEEYNTAEKIENKIIENTTKNNEGYTSSIRYSNPVEGSRIGKIKIKTNIDYTTQNMNSFTITINPYTNVPFTTFRIFLDTYYYNENFAQKHVSSDGLQYVEAYLLNEEGKLTIEILGIGLYHISTVVSAVSRLGNSTQALNSADFVVEYITDDTTSSGIKCIFKDTKVEGLLGKSISGVVVSSSTLKVNNSIYVSGGKYYIYTGETETMLPSAKTELVGTFWEEISLAAMNKFVIMSADMEDGSTVNWRLRGEQII